VTGSARNADSRYAPSINQSHTTNPSLDCTTTTSIQSDDNTTQANAVLTSDISYHAWTTTLNDSVAHTTLPVLNPAIPRDNSCHHDSSANRHVFHDRSAFKYYESSPPLLSKDLDKICPPSQSAEAPSASKASTTLTGGDGKFARRAIHVSIFIVDACAVVLTIHCKRRSHAIFSLTLIRRKYRGSGLSQRSPPPLPPNGRSPSHLARPGSILGGSSGNHVSSLTFGCPVTPSTPSAMARTSMLRPISSLGHHDTRGSLDDGNSKWVTMVSKFHFVDL